MLNQDLSTFHSPLGGLGILGYGWHKQNLVAAGWASYFDNDLASVEDEDCFEPEWEEYPLMGESLDEQGTISEEAGNLLVILVQWIDEG